MEMIGKVRRMKLRDKLSLSAIAKATGLSRNTIKKWLKAPGDITPKYVRESVAGKLTAFEETLEQCLKADSHRPKHARRSGPGRALFKQIQAQGYRGGYSAVTDFIRAWREKTGKSSSNAFVPLSFELGEAFQFDWSDEGMVVGGVFYKVQVSHLKLCASRAFWLVAYPSQGHEMLFDAHTRSFQALGATHLKGLPKDMQASAPPARQILEVVEFDGHRLDVRLKVVVKDPLSHGKRWINPRSQSGPCWAGWAMAPDMQATLVCRALQLAIVQRQPAAGLIVHSDRGSQYASGAHQALLNKHGLVGSMSRKGNCWDNAVMERFFLNLKMERVWQKDYANHAEAMNDVSDYIVSFYNSQRLHSKLGNLPPNAFEQKSAIKQPIGLCENT